MVVESTLDKILNFIIPPIIFGFLAWVLYKPFKEPIDSLWAKMKEWTSGKKEEGGYQERVTLKTIEYE